VSQFGPTLYNFRCSGLAPAGDDKDPWPAVRVDDGHGLDVRTRLALRRGTWARVNLTDCGTRRRQSCLPVYRWVPGGKLFGTGTYIRYLIHQCFNI
jgi:hypothetical protein